MACEGEMVVDRRRRGRFIIIVPLLIRFFVSKKSLTKKSANVIA